MTQVVNDLKKRWSGQGTATTALRNDSGIPGAAFGIGRVPTIDIEAKYGMYEERSIESGTRALENRIPQTKDVSGDLVIESFTPTDLARYFYGDAAVKDAGTVTGEDLGTLTSGQIAYLGNRKVSNLALTDSSVSPTTLQAGTHFKAPSARDLVFGRIDALSQTGLTPPIKAAYSYAASVLVGLCTDAIMKEYQLKLEMINTFDNTHLLIVLYRVQFDSNGLRSLIQDKGVGQSKLKWIALEDDTKPLGADLGRFGFIEYLT